MDTKLIGQFLADLRREHGLTQEKLGEKLGVTNKTVSRWENGNYLPPAEMLQQLSGLYDITINEILSGQRLTETQYRERAEENITAVMREGVFSMRERLNACGQWLRVYWWSLVLCLLPAGCLCYLLPGMTGDTARAAMLAASLAAMELFLIVNHIVFYVSGKAYASTSRPEEYRVFRVIRTAWLVILGVMVFILVDLLLALFYALTPEGTADGYAIHSMFYDILIPDGGDYLMNCYHTVEHWLWRTVQTVVINIDLTVLWMRRK